MRTLSSSCFAALAFGYALAVEAFPLQPTYDFTFDGDGKTSTNSERTAEYKEGLVGRDNDFLDKSFIDSALGKGFRLWAGSYGSGSEFRNDPFTIAAYVKAPTEPKKVIWGAGHTKDNVAIFLATGETESEIQLCVYKKDAPGLVVLATATVPDACLRPHLYTVIANKLNTESFGFYVDGAKCETAAIHCEGFKLERNNLQIGFVDGDYPPGYGRPSDDGSYMDELMIFDGTALNAALVSVLAEKFPHEVSRGLLILVR